MLELFKNKIEHMICCVAFFKTYLSLHFESLYEYFAISNVSGFKMVLVSGCVLDKPDFFYFT